jgi:hypothetical protein
MLLIFDGKLNFKCGVRVTFTYMRSSYHEYRSTGSREEARGHTDSMEMQGA